MKRATRFHCTDLCAAVTVRLTRTTKSTDSVILLSRHKTKRDARGEALIFPDWLQSGPGLWLLRHPRQNNRLPTQSKLFWASQLQSLQCNKRLENLSLRSYEFQDVSEFPFDGSDAFQFLALPAGLSPGPCCQGRVYRGCPKLPFWPCPSTPMI